MRLERARRLSHNIKKMRIAEQIPGGMFAEINLSANYLAKVMINLLHFYQIDNQSMKIYLREDRDAD